MRPQYLQTHAVSLCSRRTAMLIRLGCTLDGIGHDGILWGLGARRVKGTCFFSKARLQKLLVLRVDIGSESSVRYHFIYLFPTSWWFDTSKGILLQQVKHECCTPLKGFPLTMVDEGCVHGLRGLDGLTILHAAWRCCFLLGFPNDWFLTTQKGY